MSLTASLNSALSGLNVAQAGIAVVSDNVANVNTEGYARKSVIQNARVTGGVGTGVKVEEVRRIADQFLNSELRIAMAEFGRFEAKSTLQEQATSLIGDPTGERNLVALLDKALVAAGALSANPEASGNRSALVDALQRFGEDLDRVSDGILDLRRQADRRIDEKVGQANTLLSQVHDLNLRVASLAQSQDANGLIEQREKKLDELSQIIGIRVSNTEDRRVSISTTAGLPLLDTELRRIVHENAGSSDFGQVFSPLSVERVDSLSGQTFTIDGNIDDLLGSGELRGLLEMRDGDLNQLSVEVGAFAGQVADRINAVHNEFTAVPPPSAMTGHDTGALATDPHGFTGIASFHAFDGSNNTVATATVDFGAIGGTVNDVINAVNAGLGGAGTLALNGGVMSFAAAGGSAGVGIAQDAANPADANGRGFAHRFGLNDLVRTPTGPHFQTGLAAGSAHGFTGEATFAMVGPRNERPLSTTIDLGAVGGTVNDLLTQLNTDFAGAATFGIDGAGKLTMTPAGGFSDFRLELTADNTQRGASSRSVSDFFGLGSGPQASMAAGFAVRSDIAASPSALALAEINATGTPAVAIGDNAGAVALQGLTSDTDAFSGAGRLPAMNATLSEIGAELMGRAGQAAQDITIRAEDREALMEELKLKVAEISGVNMDEEMAQLIQLQTAFNAASRVISTTNELFDMLLQI
ncbi:MAG: flagellar hook-associated protein FlgK [Rhizobiales bacterium NRL2]|jgi:flagellar hook-associated protein 1 FlgK|nr:MAG: flagellar hook-associated protein FlgK [Rhizobiales bacterium NRL2]